MRCQMSLGYEPTTLLEGTPRDVIRAAIRELEDVRDCCPEETRERDRQLAVYIKHPAGRGDWIYEPVVSEVQVLHAMEREGEARLVLHDPEHGYPGVVGEVMDLVLDSRIDAAGLAAP